ncbi:MAG: protein kinase [Planctomycetaceae bacterium]|nr:protein kinase [Planctomycetaceae bacterium]
MSKPEFPDTFDGPDWDGFLADRLSNYGQALRSGILSSAEINIPNECPPEVLAELRDLENCLTTLKQACGLSRNPVHLPKSGLGKSSGATVFLAGDTTETGLPITSTSPVPEFSDLRLGRFEIGRKLGEGTYGIVYLAFDPQLKRNVALKIPRLEAAIRRDLHERFLFEAESAARLAHRNIVTVFEAMSDGPVSLIVSEYVQGPSLATWLENRKTAKVPPRQAAELVASLADAVSHAHDMGVLHRDIKPSNILLAPKEEGTSDDSELDQFDPKLTDFGLAKLLETQDPSVSGAIIGTPAYMPPEQIAGKTGEVDSAADIYALGMVLYELLSGKNPFITNSVAETIHNVTRGEIPPLLLIDPTIPPDLVTICHKCLRREKIDRYRNPTGLADDLRSFLDGRPIKARDVPTHEKIWKWCRRYPALSISTGTTILLMLTLLSVTSQSWRIVADANRKQAEVIGELRKRDYDGDLRAASDFRINGNVELMEARLSRHIPKPGEPDRRTFPWWYLWREINGNSEVLIQYPEGEAEAAISQDEKMLATGGEDLVIQLWALPEKRRIGELKGHTEGTIECLRFFNGTDPSGRPRNWLLSTAGDGDARLWDVDTQKQILRLTHKEWLPVAIFIGEHAEYIATGDDFGVIRIWDSSDGKLIREMSIPDTRVRALCVVPNSDLLISSDSEAGLRFWNWKIGELDPRLPNGSIMLGDQQWSGAVGLSPDRQMIAVGCTTGHLYIFSIGMENFGKEIALHVFESEIRSLVWRGDGVLLVASGRQLLLANDPYNQDCLWERFLGHRQNIWSLTASTRRPEVFSCETSGVVRHFPAQVLMGDIEVPGGQRSTAPPVWNGEYLGLKLNNGFYLVKDGSRVPTYCTPVVDSTDEGWHTPLWDGSGIIITQTKAGTEFLSCYLLPENRSEKPSDQPLWSTEIGTQHMFRRGDCFQNRYLGIGILDACLVLNPLTGEKIATLPHQSMARGIAFSPSGDRLYTTDGKGILYIWDTSDWSLIHSFKAHNGSSICVCCSEDGKLFATAGKDSKAQLYRADDFSVIASFNVSSRAYELHLMDRGKTLVVMATDRNTEMFCTDGDSPVVRFMDMNSEKLTRTTAKGNSIVTHDPWGHVHFYRSSK